MNGARPQFIVFEGLDGAGKTTASTALAERIDAVWMTTPSPELRGYREEIITSLRGNQEAAQLFYLATVFDASTRARAILRSGRSVVLDRYFLSTQAYAAFRGSTLGADELQALLLPADLTVFVDASLETRRGRLITRGASAADRETLTREADEAIRREHVMRQSLDVCGRFERVDAGRLEREEVVESVMAFIRELPVGR